jgi:hypothetical protein
VNLLAESKLLVISTLQRPNDLNRVITIGEQSTFSEQLFEVFKQPRWRRLECTESMEVIGRTITGDDQRVASTPDNHSNRISRLNNLGTVLQKRSERTGSMEDLNRAISMNGQLVAFTPDDHLAHSSRLNNFGGHSAQTICRNERNGGPQSGDHDAPTGGWIHPRQPSHEGQFNNLEIAL